MRVTRRKEIIIRALILLLSFALGGYSAYVLANLSAEQMQSKSSADFIERQSAAMGSNQTVNLEKLLKIGLNKKVEI